MLIVWHKSFVGLIELINTFGKWNSIKVCEFIYYLTDKYINNKDVSVPTIISDHDGCSVDKVKSIIR